MEGWIKLHRKLVNWEWYQDSETIHLFIHILLKANHTNKKWRGVLIKRGQLVTGRNKLAKETGISVRSVRTCLDRLVKSEILTIKPTSKFSVITICKYKDYQIISEPTDQQNDQQPTSNRPANDQQPTTNKNDKNDKNEKNIVRRTNEFRESLNFLKGTYPEIMLSDFYNYWTEPNKSNTKMRFEMEKTWDLKRRLHTWASRQPQFTKPSHQPTAKLIPIA